MDIEANGADLARLVEDPDSLSEAAAQRLVEFGWLKKSREGLVRTAAGDDLCRTMWNWKA